MKVDILAAQVLNETPNRANHRLDIFSIDNQNDCEANSLPKIEMTGYVVKEDL